VAGVKAFLGPKLRAGETLRLCQARAGARAESTNPAGLPSACRPRARPRGRPHQSTSGPISTPPPGPQQASLGKRSSYTSFSFIDTSTPGKSTKMGDAMFKDDMWVGSGSAAQGRPTPPPLSFSPISSTLTLNTAPLRRAPGSVSQWRRSSWLEAGPAVARCVQQLPPPHPTRIRLPQKVLRLPRPLAAGRRQARVPRRVNKQP
jgi:hypothetical protein